MKRASRRLRPGQPAAYQIKIQGRLDESWSAWFDCMAIAVESSDDGPPVTTLTGTVRDQPALHGLLARIRDLGLPLLQVQRVEDEWKKRECGGEEYGSMGGYD